MKDIFELIEKYFFIIVLIAVVFSLAYPNSFKWVLSTYNGINILNLLLGIILFGMGTTLKLDNFITVFKRPKEIILGISAQYLIMPLLAFSLASIFSLDLGLTVGLILVGTVPGGTASDVITFLAKGDLALSEYLPAASAIVICLIVAGVVGANKQAIISSFGIIMLIIILQYFLGILLGCIIGYLSGMGRKQIITIAIELAFQNSGLSTSLAKTHFPNLSSATVPGALYSVWQNLAGSLLAYIFTKFVDKENAP